MMYYNIKKIPRFNLIAFDFTITAISMQLTAIKGHTTCFLSSLTKRKQ
jgi:hypothetical protein